jgi:hypothetical protein
MTREDTNRRLIQDRFGVPAMEPTNSVSSFRAIRVGALAVALALIGVSLTACKGGSPAGPTGVNSSAPAAATCQSKVFVVPFDITPPIWLPGAPTIEQANFVTWETSAHAVRFLVPRNVYASGGTTTGGPPTDYLAYFMGLADNGAHFTSLTKMTLDGHPATLVTATTDRNLDGSLGCQEPGMAAHDCFGLQSDLSLRIAMLEVGGKTLLIWDRSNQAASDSDKATNVKAFEDMLTTIRFSDRPVQPPSQAANASPIDGVWVATWTYEELMASPLAAPAEFNDDNWGRYTLTFKQGQATESVTNAKKTSSGSFKFHVDGDTVTFERVSERFVMRWSITGDQLVFRRDDALGIGPTPYVIKPWIRQR